MTNFIKEIISLLRGIEKNIGGSKSLDIDVSNISEEGKKNVKEAVIDGGLPVGDYTIKTDSVGRFDIKQGDGDTVFQINSQEEDKVEIKTDVSIGGILKVDDKFSARSDAYIENDLFVNGLIDVEGSASLGGELCVASKSILNGDLTVKGTTSVQNIELQGHLDSKDPRLVVKGARWFDICPSGDGANHLEIYDGNNIAFRHSNDLREGHIDAKSLYLYGSDKVRINSPSNEEAFVTDESKTKIRRNSHNSISLEDESVTINASTLEVLNSLGETVFYHDGVNCLFYDTNGMSVVNIGEIPTIGSGGKSFQFNTDNIIRLGELVQSKEWYGTQEEYDAITTKDANTTYYIYEGE